MTQRRIAVLIDNIQSDYQVEILSGVLRATRASNINALIVAGGQLSPTMRRNFVYELLADAPIDGVLALAGSLSNLCGVKTFQDWLGRFGPLPLVCVGLDIPGRPSVYVDNGTGVYATVQHLIEKHG